MKEVGIFLIYLFNFALVMFILNLFTFGVLFGTIKDMGKSIKNAWNNRRRNKDSKHTHTQPRNVGTIQEEGGTTGTS